MTLKFLSKRNRLAALLLTLLLATCCSLPSGAQVDQGAINGTITDNTGAVIPGADVTLTSVGTGLILHAKTDASGTYIFSPVKIGDYKLSATAPGFSTKTQDQIHLDVQQRLAVNLQLSTGEVSTVVEVTAAPPLLQSEEASTGQVVEAKTINDTPLNGRNWIFITQLTAGVNPPSGSRGAGKGDFNANGQRAEQNNFILDGIDNNNNVVDFLNGASYVVRPPPDALAEFKVQTGAYSSEFGHSAGAAVNASIKSGTNQIHGDLWEYIRNDAFDVKEYFNNSVSKYRQNQFGATLGLPIIKNKVFFFGDVEANRIVFGQPHTGLSVPTALMRQGNFSELLNPALTPSGAIQLYQPGTGGLTPIPGNVLMPGQIDAVAQHILSLYPAPNTNGGKVFNNFNTVTNDTDNTWQWDARADWNISQKDQTFARFSYFHEPGSRPGQLGPILDGSTFGDAGSIVDLGEQFAFSETHVFTPTLTNEARFGYTYGHFGQFQQNIGTDVSTQIGLGGIPFGPLNGGLPNVAISGITSFGSPTFYVSNEYTNTYQILDNVTKIIGNHSIRAGINLEHVRFSTQQPTQSRGSYTFNGLYTSKPGVGNTGYGVADFLTNSMNSSAVSNLFNTDDVRWDRAGYAQDDWKVNEALTINYGIRYEYAQPYLERHDHQAAFIVTGPLSPGAGTAVYRLPSSQRSTPLAPKFLNLLASNNITLQYTSNRFLVDPQQTNFAPRIGFAYRLGQKTVVRGGYGLFYGGLESAGYYPNLGENFPFEFDSAFNPLPNDANPNANCNPGNCPTNGFTLETGFTNAINQGLFNAISTPALRGSDAKVRTPYSQQYNLAVEYALSNNLTATASYVGSLGRHLIVFPDPNSPAALLPSGGNINPVRPFPGFGGSAYSSYAGSSNYNALQTKLERRFSSGLSFLGTYTYSHSLDDAPTPLGSTGDSGYRGTNLVPINLDYSNSAFDVRHRVTVNGNYQLPVGRGRRYLSSGSELEDLALGGWSLSLVFRAQTGEPFTVAPGGSFTAPAGAGTRAIRVADPFSSNLQPPAQSNGGATTCPNKVRTPDHWFNPCAFVNPPVLTQQVNGIAAIPYLGSVRNNWYAPGYERIDASLFKNFATFREQSLQLRVDAFNVLNTPAYGYPSDATDGNNGGQITGPRFFQNFTPDSRFFQFAAKYIF